jgi:hypothetical protein
VLLWSLDVGAWSCSEGNGPALQIIRARALDLPRLIQIASRVPLLILAFSLQHSAFSL